jgi:hypothetical protein
MISMIAQAVNAQASKRSTDATRPKWVAAPFRLAVLIRPVGDVRR